MELVNIISENKTSIFFVSRFLVGNSRDTLGGKFAGQIAACRRMGLSVHWLECDQDGIYLCGQKPRVRISSHEVLREYSLLRSIQGYNELYKAARASLSLLPDVDYVYVRQGFAIPAYRRFLEDARHAGARTVVEIPSFPSAREGKLSVNPFAVLGVRAARSLDSRVAKLVDLFAVIGEDVGGTFMGRPAINISNGVDLKASPIRAIRAPSGGDSLRLLGVAAVSAWHGFDRVIRGMAAWSETCACPEIIFHIVGPDGDGSLKDCVQLASELGLERHVFVHGPKTGAELDVLYDAADIGVSSLGLARIGRRVSDTLKSKEYMARGLPFIYATKDPTLLDAGDFCLQLHDGEDLVNFRPVIQFGEALSVRRDVSNRMRRYAQEKMSWDSQLSTVFERVSTLRE